MITVLRLYRDHDTGARVVTELERSGVPRDDISIMASNEGGWFDGDRAKTVDRDADGVDDRAEGAAKGAGIGGALGGVAGLLAGLGLLAIPGIGPVVAAGWLASTAAVAAAGGAAGGLIGALTQWGVGEDEARSYEEGVRRGGTLVTVRAEENRRAAVEAIMGSYNPVDAHTLRAGQQSVSGDRIIAVFENTAKAAEARQALVGAGIDNARMELLDRRSDLENWTAIKRHSVPDEDTHLYAEGLDRGHSILAIQVPAGEHEHVMRVLERFSPLDIDEHAAQWRQAGWSGVHAGKAAWEARRTQPAATAATGTQEEVIPVYEENLKVGKRTIEQDHVRVRVYTVERPVEEGLTLREERVAVERRPVDRPASGVPGEPFKERTVDVTTHREEPVVAKEARVKEEIVVRKEADERRDTVQGTVRRNEVDVEDDRAEESAIPSSTTPKP
jgi:stress response protein YsnF